MKFSKIKSKIPFSPVFALIVVTSLYFLLTKKETVQTTSTLGSSVGTTKNEKEEGSPDAVSDSGYRSVKTVSKNPIAELSKEVGSKNISYVLAFNRLDSKHVRQGATIIIPDNLSNWDALSPFPSSLSVAQNVPKLLVVSQRIQAFAVYESGSLIRWGPVSTGKKTNQTPSKLYTMNWKGKLVVSSVKDEWILPWYFNLDNLEGISLHQYALPGYPASHSCVRMLEKDAEWIYNWGEQWVLDDSGKNKIDSGTPVILFGEYAYDQAPPWRNLPGDPQATKITEEELTEAVSAYLGEIEKQVNKNI